MDYMLAISAVIRTYLQGFSLSMPCNIALVYLLVERKEGGGMPSSKRRSGVQRKLGRKEISVEADIVPHLLTFGSAYGVRTDSFPLAG